VRSSLDPEANIAFVCVLQYRFSRIIDFDPPRPQTDVREWIAFESDFHNKDVKNTFSIPRYDSVGA
jgi:hypothetical protein